MTAPLRSLSDGDGSRVVLVGISRYTDLPDLPAVENNLTALRDAFTRGPWRLPAEHCVTILDEHDPAAVLDALTDAGSATDTLIFYYAGHGFTDPLGEDDQLLLALHRSSPDGRRHRSLSYAAVRRVLLDPSVRAGKKVVILDCCYAGLAQGLGGADTLGNSAGIIGSYVLTATSPNAKALSPPGEPYTGFTGALLKAHRDGIPGAGPILDMSTIYDWLVPELRNRNLPRPHQINRDLGGKIAFIVNRAYTPGADAGPYPHDPVPRTTRTRPALTRRRMLVGGAGVAAAGTAAYLLARLNAGRRPEQPGVQIWRRHFTAVGTPHLGERNVLVTLEDGRIVGLAPADGAVRWQRALTGEQFTRASVVKGTLLVSAATEQGKGRLTALDEDGETRWSLDTDGWPWHQEPGPNDKVYLATSTGWIYQVNRPDGKTDYAQKISGQLNEVKVSGNFLYISTHRDGLIVIGKDGGAPEWSRTARGFVPGAAVDEVLVYRTVGYTTSSGSYRGSLQALDVNTGKTRWEKEFDTLIQAGPTLAAGQVIVPDSRGTLHSFDPMSGTKTWQEDVGADVNSRLTYDGETVYVGTSRGVAALSPYSGEVRWKKEVVVTPPASFYSATQPVIDDHTVYFGYGNRTTSGTDCDIYAFSR
ncbi:caspase, EACC1-associated type [Rhizohabitans arisaemae]|uniref:caspase, EACC1-associated type n=1 Tax=Rhizohabitans arisaemae TaxID=2720610 RepID=UPI0024B04F39|nr:PQQ-binding-like beta-propeller repeat protein [Rhizohabitans arisaemae]